MKPCADENRPRTAEPHLLILSYGNELRGDDGVAPVVARRIEALNQVGVRILVRQQLTPELADDIALAERVIFIDAAVDIAEVTVREVIADSANEIVTHSSSPMAILALAKAVYGRNP